MKMKTILVGINSKYIHPNLAIRYLKANTTYPVDILEFNIKDPIESIVTSCLEHRPDLIGFSVYIWNINIINNVLKHIRHLSPTTKILLGGPEVSFVNQNYFDNQLTDYIIVNEGEIAFHLLLTALNHHNDLSNIPNLIYQKDGKTIKNKCSVIENLDALKDPYTTIDEKDISHKIQYVELSRGCPYKCSYCLASLEKGVRFFSMKRVKKTIQYLANKGAKTFKFLDRSFNANHKLAQELLTFIIDQNYQDIVFQFEINGDVLKDSFIDFLIKKAPSNLIRFELGIQSTNDQVNQAVRRYQDTTKLIENIKKLKQSNVVLHLDLIAGLPLEDLESFKNTFNTIYQLFGHELQLGFLKVLKGTDIYHKASLYQITYDSLAPYEIIESQYISKEDLAIIHQVEIMLNIYWNKGFMPKTMTYLTQNQDAFAFFLDLYQFYINNQYSTLRYGLIDLFTRLIDFLKQQNKYNHTIDSYLKYDYLNHHPIKPKIYWQHPTHKNQILRDYQKTNPNIPIDLLYKHSVVTEYLTGYLIVFYQRNHKLITFFEY